VTNFRSIEINLHEYNQLAQTVAFREINLIVYLEDYKYAEMKPLLTL